MGTANLVKGRLTLQTPGRIRHFFNPVNFNWLIGNNPVNSPSAAAANVEINRNAADYVNSNKKDVLTASRRHSMYLSMLECKSRYNWSIDLNILYMKYSFLQTPRKKSCCRLVARLMPFNLLRKCLHTDQQGVALLFYLKHPSFRLFPILSKHKPFRQCWWKSYTTLPTKLHGLV